eukprot:TRINITY_DN728_c0_g2_i1.p1 TRINITY_DN728_c0_g2~~TRINITY_DN728_c0_g2_i1.p1  ORF type:complete len:306 (+),score=78.39 TRINITY_DN728_c0_g2_i1:212-1129(+)
MSGFGLSLRFFRSSLPALARMSRTHITESIPCRSAHSRVMTATSTLPKPHHHHSHHCLYQNHLQAHTFTTTSSRSKITAITSSPSPSKSPSPLSFFSRSSFSSHRHSTPKFVNQQEQQQQRRLQQQQQQDQNQQHQEQHRRHFSSSAPRLQRNNPSSVTIITSLLREHGSVFAVVLFVGGIMIGVNIMVKSEAKKTGAYKQTLHIVNTDPRVLALLGGSVVKCERVRSQRKENRLTLQFEVVGENGVRLIVLSMTEKEKRKEEGGRFLYMSVTPEVQGIVDPIVIVEADEFKRDIQGVKVRVERD